MDLWRIAVRALVAYIYLLTVTRATGKRVVSQATPFDFVVSLILGDLIDDALWAEVSTAKFAVGTATICFCDILTKLGGYHSQRFFKLVNGVPSIVLRDGVEDGRELRSEQLNEIDLAHLLRLEGMEKEKWNEVHLGLVERDHNLSMLYRPEAEPAMREDAPKVKEMVE